MPYMNAAYGGMVQTFWFHYCLYDIPPTTGGRHTDAGGTVRDVPGALSLLASVNVRHFPSIADKARGAAGRAAGRDGVYTGGRFRLDGWDSGLRFLLLPAPVPLCRFYPQQTLRRQCYAYCLLVYFSAGA